MHRKPIVVKNNMPYPVEIASKKYYRIDSEYGPIDYEQQSSFQHVCADGTATLVFDTNHPFHLDERYAIVWKQTKASPEVEKLIDITDKKQTIT